MSTTAGPNVPFSTGRSYLMPAIETDASPAPLSVRSFVRAYLAVVIYQDLWQENMHSAGSRRVGDNARPTSRGLRPYTLDGNISAFGHQTRMRNKRTLSRPEQ